jgi:large subunit ribosomal protein L22
MVKAELKNYRQSPRKVRLVADLIRGKKAEDALTLLDFTVKRSSDPLRKLLESAIANAKHNFDIPVNELFIKEIRVDEGPTLKRFRARAFGRASGIKKRTSRVFISLDKTESKDTKKTKKVEKVEKVEKITKATPKKKTTVKEATKVTKTTKK